MTPIATGWCGDSCGWCLLSPSRLLGQRVQDVQQAGLCDTLVERLVALQSAAGVKSPGGCARAACSVKCPWHGTRWLGQAGMGCLLLREQAWWVSQSLAQQDPSEDSLVLHTLGGASVALSAFTGSDGGTGPWASHIKRGQMHMIWLLGWLQRGVSRAGPEVGRRHVYPGPSRAHHLQLLDSVAIACHNVGVVQGSPTGSICALPLSSGITT